MALDTTVIDNATILAGATLEPIERGRLVLRGEQIAAVGAADQVGVPEGAGRTDASGLVLIPGFIDAHVHIAFASPGEVLRQGVTTVRDLGWPPPLIFELSERSRDPSFDGPEIIAAGPIFTVEGGYPTRAAWAPEGTGFPLASAAEARTAVRGAVEAGSRVIKFALNPEVGPVLDLDTLRALVEAAHDEGLKATGHVSGLTELDKAMAAGADELAHMLMSTERIPQETIEAMVANGMAVVPTLSVRFGRDREVALANLSAFADAGGTVVYGTDLGNQGPEPGIDRREVDAMAEAGFEALDIIASATVVASEWLDLPAKGVLEEGRDADVLALPREVLDDPLRLTEVAMVWRRGRRVR
ncbi:MAG: amidohydrolase family protein [Actinomycetota bacterium]|nr:amidohydrolase family protein [Actinomycetota bacterium]